MSLDSPKASSVTEAGELDGFVIEPGWEAQRAAGGDNRLLVSVPTAQLRTTHAALVGVLEAPLGFLYRRHLDRSNPGPQGAPPTDFVALHQPHEAVLGAVDDAAELLFHDARCELWIRGKRGDQVILDQDGLLFCYPDDPAFRDALNALGVPEASVDTMLERDYVKHWYHASNDEVERRLIDRLALVQVGYERRRAMSWSDLPRVAHIAHVKIEPNLVLAPMEGVTDLTFRRLIRAVGGCGLTVTEFVPARSLKHGGKRELSMVQFDADERPVSVQIFGRDPEIMAEGARYVQGLGATLVDLNMGCPSKRVCAHSGGSALMREPELARDIVRAMRAAVDIPFTVKMRSGWDPSSKNAPDLAYMCQEEGADAVAVHWRTREDKYGGERELDTLALVVQRLSIPVFANGDVVDVPSAEQTLRETGAAGLMVGRGAVRNPWLFAQIADAQAGRAPRWVDDSERERVLLAYFADIRTRFGSDHGALGRFKKIARYFTEAVDGGDELRQRIFHSQTADEAIEVVHTHFAEIRAAS